MMTNGVVSTGSGRRPARAVGLRVGSFFVTINYAPYLIAKSNGLFDNLGNDGVTYITFQSLAPITEAFASKQIDAVFEAAPPALISKSAGIDLKIVSVSCSVRQRILVPVQSKAISTADLTGARIAVLTGTSSHYAVFKILKDEGIEADKVEIANMIPTDAWNAFRAGQVDAWAIWSPFVEQAEITRVGRVLLGGSALVHSILAVRGSFAKKNRTTVEAIVDVLNNTKAWMQREPQMAQATVADVLDIPKKVVERAWPRHDWAAS
jgi:sulfonate transport system substrate-binding protein